MTLKKKILSIILIILFTIIGSGAVYAYGILNSISAEDLDADQLSINTDLDTTGVVNVALFGLDGRDEEDLAGSDRSDTIMIASLNFETGEAKVVSLMRDLLVQLTATENNDYYVDKINAAYSFGGVQAAIRTINENFDLNIRDYAVVNFDCLVDTINALDGVDVDIKNEDVLYWTNEYIGPVMAVTGKWGDPIQGIGPHHLNGVQALAYCRNRYSDSDYGRTARQREVITQILEKLMSSDLLTIMNVLRSVYPYVTTSLSLGEISDYAQSFLALQERTIMTSRLPFDGINTTGDVNDSSCVIPTTLEDNAKVLHCFLFGDNDYVPSLLVSEISREVAELSGFGSTVDWSRTTPQDILNDMAISAANDTGTPQTGSVPTE